MATGVLEAGVPTGGFLDKARTIAGPGFNRWLVPPCALAIHLCIGMAYGFFIYRHWAFVSPGTRSLLAEIRDFLLVNAAGAAVTLVVAVGADWSLARLLVPHGISQAGGHALGIAVGALVNYLGHKHVTFRTASSTVD